MLGNYNANLKITAHEIKEEISNISKGSGDITLSNSISADDKADDEKERIREKLEEMLKETKEVNHEFKEEIKRRMEETTIHFCKSIVY